MRKWVIPESQHEKRQNQYGPSLQRRPHKSLRGTKEKKLVHFVGRGRTSHWSASVCVRVCVSVSVCFSPAPVRLCLHDCCVLYTKCLRVIWRGWWLRANVNYLYMHWAPAQLTAELINNQTPLEDPSTKRKKKRKKQEQPGSVSKAFSSQMDFSRSSYSLCLRGTAGDFFLTGAEPSPSRPAPPLGPSVHVLVLWDEPGPERGQTLHRHRGEKVQNSRQEVTEVQEPNLLRLSGCFEATALQGREKKKGPNACLFKSRTHCVFTLLMRSHTSVHKTPRQHSDKQQSLVLLESQ